MSTKVRTGVGPGALILLSVMFLLLYLHRRGQRPELLFESVKPQLERYQDKPDGSYESYQNAHPPLARGKGAATAGWHGLRYLH